ncbi:MAG TPA: DNA polymerase/3'-5' exonuclease PolX [Thermodesulfobacteriota bacterium]|nr:DNA polymerase/3'-5' exonuclease PolX [Thermodesulfobacteriota bacterium]
MSKNREIGDIFDSIADILDLREDNPFRIRAYRNAARNIRELTENIENIAERDELTKIPGVGTDLSEKIKEFITTGKINQYDELKKKVPEGLVELLAIKGVGPKTLAKLNKEIGVKNLNDLERALEGKEILTLRGMGQKKIEDIKRGIELLKQSGERMPLGIALPLAEELIFEISKIPGTEGTIAAGSLRRMKETVGDIDILTMAENGERVIKAFTKLSLVKEVLAAGDTKGSVILKNGMQVDLRVIEPGSYGAALQYFTGSKAHNIKLRTLALEKDLKINEYGVFRGTENIAGETEEEIYKTLELPWIPPEIREDKGEIEAASDEKLPNLIELRDIRGDLQMHSKWSDGKATIEEMALRARELGYEYIAMTDHSPSSRIAKGLSVERLYEKKKEVEAINKKIKGMSILMGSEVDIKGDGSLDYPDTVLKHLDIVLVAVHSGFKMNSESMTKRIVIALQNPYVHALVHPTGRLIGEREAYEVDMDEVIKTAKALGKALEVNSYYLRLDLNDINVRKAIQTGVKIVISTDAHLPDQLSMMRLGVATARRGWAEKKDVVNTMDLKGLTKWLSEVRGK